MKIIRKFFLWLFGGVIFLLLMPLLLLLLFAPLRYAVVARVGDGTTVRVKASYLFRFITVRYLYQKGKGVSRVRVLGIPVGGGARQTIKDEPATEKEEAVAEDIKPTDERPAPEPSPGYTEKDPHRFKGILTYPELKTIIRLVFQCIKKTAGVLLPKRLDIIGTVGFSDPAATGVMAGIYENAAALLSLRDKVRLTADFTRPGVRLKVSAKGSVNGARLLWPVVWLVCKKPIRRFYNTYFRK
jgi:hypothetical protein